MNIYVYQYQNSFEQGLDTLEFFKAMSQGGQGQQESLTEEQCQALKAAKCCSGVWLDFTKAVVSTGMKLGGGDDATIGAFTSLLISNIQSTCKDNSIGENACAAGGRCIGPSADKFFETLGVSQLPPPEPQDEDDVSPASLTSTHMAALVLAIATYAQIAH